jgi:hypothetical protein
VLAQQSLEIGQPTFSNTTDRRAQFEDGWIRQTVVHE